MKMVLELDRITAEVTKMAEKRKFDGNSHTKSQRDDYANQYNPNSDAYAARVRNEEKMKAEQDRRYIQSMFVPDMTKAIPGKGWNIKPIHEVENNLQSFASVEKYYKHTTSWPDPVPANGWRSGYNNKH